MQPTVLHKFHNQQPNCMAGNKEDKEKKIKGLGYETKKQKNPNTCRQMDASLLCE